MRSRRSGVPWLAVVIGILWAGPGLAHEPPAAAPAPAMPAFPLDKVPERLRPQVKQVVERPTLLTRGPREVFAGQPALYYWFLDHPDRAATVWRRLGAQCVELTDRGNGRFSWSDGQGSEVRWESAHAGPRQRIWYAEGKVNPGPLLPTVPVKVVLVLNCQEGRDEAGRSMLRHQVDLYVHSDSKTLSWVTRLLGASAPRIAEQYLSQLQMFFSGLVYYVELHPERSEKLLAGVVDLKSLR